MFIGHSKGLSCTSLGLFIFLMMVMMIMLCNDAGCALCCQMVNVNWLFFFSKIIELADTVSILTRVVTQYKVC